MRIGLGYDNHRLVPGRPLLLGGVTVPAPVGAEAHSDGDVLIHALVDALLGAVGAGDIGTHFPDSDPRWKGQASRLFLEKAAEIVRGRGYRIGNIDAVVVLEKVKLGALKADIARNLRDILAPFGALAEDAVSVKAKTNERCDAVGEGRAIVAQVAVLLVEDSGAAPAEASEMALQVYNTLTRKKEEFVPLEPGRVRMYNCGPTVYSYAHIGNFATFLLADLLRRFLESAGVQVLQVMNITDVGHMTDDARADGAGEDKLERKAREERKDPWQIARFYEEAFQRDREALNLLPAHHYPRATDHIPEMVEMIRELLGKGLAYEAKGQIYFEISKFPRYGVLSGNTPQELLAGARVEEDPHKRNPLDFCLWKKDARHLMQWDSPWGRGFPGWHIECSAMSRKYLGTVFDVHTGGEDNIFPHHECEIAQSSGGEGRIFARYWLHRRHILVDGRKMSKREGNFYTVADLLAKGFSGTEVRYALMSGHYRAKLNFTLESLEAARESTRRLANFLDDMSARPEDGAAGDAAAVEALAREANRGFREALEDDLNISGALSSVFGFLHDANRTARSRAAGEIGIRTLLDWDRVLGLRLADAFLARKVKPEAAAAGTADTVPAAPGASAGRPSAEEVERLLAERETARRRKDFRRADEIRNYLVEKGVAIKDGPQGPRWSYL